MKIFSLTFILLLTLQISLAQKCVSINPNENSSYSLELQHSDNSMIVDVSVNNFYINEIETPRGLSCYISADDMMPVASAGQPNMPSFSLPIIVDDFAKMKLKVNIVEYTDYDNIEIAPSKGDFPRNLNPSDVPFVYDDVYNQNEFFPMSSVKLDSPYILRDFRAQNVIVTPFAYNPKSNVLRVFNKIRIEIVKTDVMGDNVLQRRSDITEITDDFKKLYENRFLNFKNTTSRYDAVGEQGSLLIICHDAFVDAMSPFVEWKKSIGRETKIVSTLVTGETVEEIKSYITEEYNDNPELAYVLLVGDVTHIPAKYISAADYSGLSDWWYGQIDGDDFYNELIVGRFSAEDVSHVMTQVERVIHYERDIDTDDKWLTSGLGISKRENQQGHNGEDDYQHIDNIRTDLLAYNYTDVYRDYTNIDSIKTTADTISKHINEGVSIINYCNHGMPTKWTVCNYNNNHVNALTNDNKLPYIISVACYNGQYDYKSPCFAEAWLRATNDLNGNPTGAIGGMFSYISQPWIPPMYAQDEMIDILVESYSNNIKRTMGGVSLNGNMKILDYSQSISSYYGTYNTWNLFGDPTLTLRNDIPTLMDVYHTPMISTLSTAMTVEVNDGEGSLVTLSRDGEIMGSALVNNGTAIINYEAPLTEGTATLTVFGYNKKTYQKDIAIKSDVNEHFNAFASVSPNIIPQGESSELNVSVVGGSYEYSYKWSPSLNLNDDEIKNPIATPSETTTYICEVSDGNTTINTDVTLFVVTPPTNIDYETEGNDIILSWEKPSLADSYNIYSNGYKVAYGIEETTFFYDGLKFGVYDIYVTSVYEGVESPKSETVFVNLEQLTVSVFANPSFIIKGASTKLFANVSQSFSDVTYYWSPEDLVSDTDNSMTEATPLTTTEFTVTVTSNSQTASATVIVEVLEEPKNLSFTLDGNDVELKWNQADHAEIYRIRRNGETIVNYLTDTTFVDKDVPNGNYCYTVISVRNEFTSPESEEVCVEVFDDTNVNDINADEKIRVYPNPVADNLIVEADRINGVMLVDIMGQVVLKNDFNSDAIILDVSVLNPGLYMLHIDTDSGIVIRKINIIE